MPIDQIDTHPLRALLLTHTLIRILKSIQFGHPLRRIPGPNLLLGVRHSRHIVISFGHFCTDTRDTVSEIRNNVAKRRHNAGRTFGSFSKRCRSKAIVAPAYRTHHNTDSDWTQGGLSHDELNGLLEWG